MKIKVKAGKDPVTGAARMMHFPMSVKAAPGGKTLCISGDTVVEVDDTHRFVRRRLKVGDLVLVASTKTKRETTSAADKAAKE